MKTFTFLFLIISHFSFSSIIYQDIPDYSMTTPSVSAYAFDFNNDGTPEFTLECNPGRPGTSGMYLDFSTDHGFITWSSVFGISGWDNVRPLSLNSSINENSDWGPSDFSFNLGNGVESQDLPIGDSYVGCFMTISSFRYYGWILVNYNGTNFTIKSFAYENVPNSPILSGNTSLSTESFSSSPIKYQYNYFSKALVFDSLSSIKSIKTFNLLGQDLNIPFFQNELSFFNYPTGFYILSVTLNDNKKYAQKIFIY
jgi:hypothetical protein